MSDIAAAPDPPPRTPDVDDVYAAIGEHGSHRIAALAAAGDHLTDAIELARVALEAGADLNLTEVARRAGVTRQTIYQRLPADLIDARRGDDPPEGA